MGLIVSVDAICINQKGCPERRYQVQLMRQIYEGARQVVSWLGMPSVDLQVVHNLLKEQDLEKTSESQNCARTIVYSAFNYTHLDKWSVLFSLLAADYWK